VVAEVPITNKLQLLEASEPVAAAVAVDQEMIVQFQHLVVLVPQVRVLLAEKVVVQMVQTAEHFGVVVIHGPVAAAVVLEAQALTQQLMHRAALEALGCNLISAEHLHIMVVVVVAVTV
jgi:hypothetical protein